MIPTAIRRPLQAIAWAVGLTAFVQAASPAESPTGRADIRSQLAEQILTAQKQEGPHAKALIELSAALGLVYAESGNHAKSAGSQLLPPGTGSHSLRQPVSALVNCVHWKP